MDNNKLQDLIKHLGLEQHPKEGGFFRRTYTASHSINTSNGSRSAMSSIYYMLTSENPINRLHFNQSDIMHYYHCGGAIRYTLLAPDGSIQHVTLGHDYEKGQNLQLCVPGGYWKASELLDSDYGLISEAVCPGFDFADNQVATLQTLQDLIKQHQLTIEQSALLAGFVF